jgi:hypothetical protein
MMGGDLRLAQAWMVMNVNEFRRQAHADALVREVTGGQTGWFSWRGGQVLVRLGSQLVQLGERLEQYALAEAAR